MRFIFILVLLSITPFAAAIEWEDQATFKGSANTTQTLRILSSTDTDLFAPIINGFLNSNPHLTIEYLVTETVKVYDVFIESPGEYDVVISSAMDLQLKLVNDGYARRSDTIDYPDWAEWRRSLFGFTLEPAAIVVNRLAFTGLKIPKTRQEMIEVLRENPAQFRGKLGTYDVRQSGLGYLFATQDARTSETYWRLMEVMGNLQTRVYCCSGAMIDDLAQGKLSIAYNVLGSYAFARADLEDKIAVILPSDFTTTMMRTAFVSKDTQLADEATIFLRHLTSSEWSTGENGRHPIPSLDATANNTQQSTISLGPSLMIYLDRLKRKAFIEAWESAIIQ